MVELIDEEEFQIVLESGLRHGLFLQCVAILIHKYRRVDILIVETAYPAVVGVDVGYAVHSRQQHVEFGSCGYIFFMAGHYVAVGFVGRVFHLTLIFRTSFFDFEFLVAVGILNEHFGIG